MFRCETVDRLYLIFSERKRAEREMNLLLRPLVAHNQLSVVVEQHNSLIDVFIAWIVQKHNHRVFISMDMHPLIIRPIIMDV